MSGGSEKKKKVENVAQSVAQRLLAVLLYSHGTQKASGKLVRVSAGSSHSHKIMKRVLSGHSVGKPVRDGETPGTSRKPVASGEVESTCP